MSTYISSPRHPTYLDKNDLPNDSWWNENKREVGAQVTFGIRPLVAWNGKSMKSNRRESPGAFNSMGRFIFAVEPHLIIRGIVIVWALDEFQANSEVLLKAHLCI